MKLLSNFFYILILSTTVSFTASANIVQISMQDISDIQDAVTDYFDRYYAPGMCQDVADFRARVLLGPELSEEKALATFYYRCLGSDEWLYGETCEVEKTLDEGWLAVYCDN